MHLSDLSNSSWQKWILLLALLGVVALWISPVSSSELTDWMGKGNSFYNAGRYEDALAAYNKALELDPNWSRAWNNKGTALNDLGRYEEALAALNKAIELDSKYATPWFNKGNTLYKLSRYEEALAAYNKALELDPKDAKTWGGKGNALTLLGRYDEALAAYNKALELDPNLTAIRTNKNLVLSKLNQGTTTIVTTPTIQTPNPVITTSRPNQMPTSQDPTLFNPLIIVGIILLLCIGGGGYYLHHSRKTKHPLPSAIGMQSSPSEQATSSPYLSLTTEKIQLVVDKWHRVPVHITNTGTTQAIEVSFTFSDEFETKWIKPVSIETGASIDVIIGVRPKQWGNIPLEIRVKYQDSQDKEYKQTFEYWIDVVEKGTTDTSDTRN